MSRLQPLGILLAALLACGGTTPAVSASDAQVAVDRGMVPDAGAPVDVPAASDVVAAEDVVAASDVPAMAGAYPEGPYGNREGAVLANLEWEGYVNTAGTQRSTELEFGPTSLQALRGDGRGYALIHLAEFL